MKWNVHRIDGTDVKTVATNLTSKQAIWFTKQWIKLAKPGRPVLAPVPTETTRMHAVDDEHPSQLYLVELIAKAEQAIHHLGDMRDSELDPELANLLRNNYEQLICMLEPV